MSLNRSNVSARSLTIHIVSSALSLLRGLHSVKGSEDKQYDRHHGLDDGDAADRKLPLGIG